MKWMAESQESVRFLFLQNFKWFLLDSFISICFYFIVKIMSNGKNFNETHNLFLYSTISWKYAERESRKNYVTDIHISFKLIERAVLLIFLLLFSPFVSWNKAWDFCLYKLSIKNLQQSAFHFDLTMRMNVAFIPIK